MLAFRPANKLINWIVANGGVANWSNVRDRSGELSWVLLGKLAVVGANAAVMLALASLLELASYGFLVLTISAQLLLSRVLMVGVDVGMLRLNSIPELRPRSHEVVTAGLAVMGCTFSAFLLIALLTAPALTWRGIPSWMSACVVAGAMGTSLVDYGYSFRLARHEYQLSALSQGGTAIGRLVLATLAALMLPGYVLVVFLVYHGSSLLSGLAQTLVLARKVRLRADRALIRRLLRYSLWQGATNFLVIFSLYQGTFLLMLLGQPVETGIFGLSSTFSLGIFAIYSAYSEYLRARISSIESLERLPRFMVTAMGGALLLALLCGLLITAVAALIPWVLRPELLEVVPVFLYLAAAMVGLMLFAPVEVACHYLLRPHLVSLGWLMRALFIAAAGLILAPGINATVAAIAQLIGSVLGSLALTVVVARALRSSLAAEFSGGK